MYIHERYFKNNLTQNQSLVLILQGLLTASPRSQPWSPSHGTCPYSIFLKYMILGKLSCFVPTYRHKFRCKCHTRSYSNINISKQPIQKLRDVDNLFRQNLHQLQWKIDWNNGVSQINHGILSKLLLMELLICPISFCK